MEIDDKDPQSELFIVAKEIMSLHKERRELLSSLTPGVSEWKGLGQPETLPAANNFTPAPVKQMERSSTHEQLGWYLDSISHDMDDLVHRMLSMAYVVVKPDGAAISTYIADELVNSTSKLKDACKELYTDTKDAYRDPEKEVHEYALSAFCHRFLSSPLEFENKLTLVITKEMEENYRKEVEKERKRVWEIRKENMAHFKQWEKEQKEMEKKEQKKMEKMKGKEMEKKKGKEMEKKGKRKKGLEKHKEYVFMDHDEYKDLDQGPYQEMEKENLDLDPNTLEYLEKGMEVKEKFFADDRDAWNSTWGSKSTRCGDFRDKTTLSPMHFTHYTRDTIQSSCGVTGSTLEIYSIKILELKKRLKWPLKLYGVVAARDTVDRNRNILFSRSSLHYQELGENGSLCLTGPSRAIVALDYVDFEVELEIKEGEESQGKELMTLSKRYDGTGTTLMFENSLCKAVLKLSQLSGAVQATIVGVCVVEGEWPFEYGCRVACSLDAAADEVVLLDCRGGPGGGSKDKEVHVGSNGYLHLSRNVVSVQSEGTLRVFIRSYSRSGCVDREWNIDFPAQKCQTSEKECLARTTNVKVVVAWSLLVKEKRDLLVDFPAVET